VYISNQYGWLYAINPDGTQRWVAELADSVNSANAGVGRDGTVYLASNKLYAFYPDGTLKWAFTPAAPFSRDTSPAFGIDGATVYAGSDKLYAVNLDGTLQWQYDLPQDSCLGPAVASDRTIYAVSYTNSFGSAQTLYALRFDGTLKWTLEAGDFGHTGPAVAADKTVYFRHDSYGTLDNYLCAARPDGTVKWTHQVQMGYGSQIGIGLDGTVYIPGYNTLYALDPADGSEKWKFDTQQYLSGAPAIDKYGNIFVSDMSMCKLNPEGQLLWSSDEYGFGYSQAALGPNGTLYAQTNMELLAFGSAL